MSGATSRNADVLRAARRSSLLTQHDIASLLGKSVATIGKYEREPEDVSLSTFATYYNACGTDAKAWIKDYVDSFFCVQGINQN